jgi:hypothetical protein
MKPYIILTSDNANLLANEVCRKIEMGYRPIGGVAVCIKTYASIVLQYSQAMI